MKHLVLLLTLLLASVLNLGAQTSQIAILAHDGEITTYSGGDALIAAYAASVDGDVITLSPGVFNYPDFKKSKVTIRGAGMMPEENPTVLHNSGTINLNIAPTEANTDVQMVFEGLMFKDCLRIERISNILFNKVMFSDIVETYIASNIVDKVTFIHCIINDFNQFNKNNYYFLNCFICRPENYFTVRGYSTFNNCTLKSGSSFSLSNCTLNNCLMICVTNTNGSAISTPSTYGCVHVGDNMNVFNNSISTTNRCCGAGTVVFKEGTDIWELTDENAATWLGTDGTQVGMHGGALPFDPTTTNPQIAKFNVAPKTTADGKLSVDIEVKAD